MKLEINKRKAGKGTSMWKLNNTLLNNQWSEKAIKKLKNIETNRKLKHNIPKPMG